jgi:hypothetical protein
MTIFVTEAYFGRGFVAQTFWQNYPDVILRVYIAFQHTNIVFEEPPFGGGSQDLHIELLIDFARVLQFLQILPVQVHLVIRQLRPAHLIDREQHLRVRVHHQTGLPAQPSLPDDSPEMEQRLPVNAAYLIVHQVMVRHSLLATQHPLRSLQVLQDLRR